jgi:hypothetical protein
MKGLPKEPFAVAIAELAARAVTEAAESAVSLLRREQTPLIPPRKRGPRGKRRAVPLDPRFRGGIKVRGTSASLRPELSPDDTAEAARAVSEAVESGGFCEVARHGRPG